MLALEHLFGDDPPRFVGHRVSVREGLPLNARAPNGLPGRVVHSNFEARSDGRTIGHQLEVGTRAHTGLNEQLNSVLVGAQVVVPVPEPTELEASVDDPGSMRLVS